MKLAFIVDPLDEFKIYKDTTYVIMREAARRGHELYSLHQGDLAWTKSGVTGNASRLHMTGEETDAWYLLEPPSERPLTAYDAVLMLGPLYHLPDRADRVRALSEARRVVKPGGPVIIALISRFASLLDGLRSGTLSDPSVRPYIQRVLETGVNANPGKRPEYFTTAYFHHPDEIEGECEDAGLRCETVLGIEGLGWLTWEKWDDPEGRENILRVARALEDEPTVKGASTHLLAVAR